MALVFNPDMAGAYLEDLARRIEKIETVMSAEQTIGGPVTPTHRESECQIVSTLRDVGHRCTTTELIREMDKRKLQPSDSTVKKRLAEMVKERRLDKDRRPNRQGTASRSGSVVPRVPSVHEPVPELTCRFACETMPPVGTIRVSTGGLHDRLGKLKPLISLADAAGELPRRRRGRKTHVSTLFRWTTIGCRGVVLESLQMRRDPLHVPRGVAAVL